MKPSKPYIIATLVGVLALTVSLSGCGGDDKATELTEQSITDDAMTDDDTKDTDVTEDPPFDGVVQYNVPFGNDEITLVLLGTYMDGPEASYRMEYTSHVDADVDVFPLLVTMGGKEVAGGGHTHLAPMTTREGQLYVSRTVVTSRAELVGVTFELQAKETHSDEILFKQVLQMPPGDEVEWIDPEAEG